MTTIKSDETPHISQETLEHPIHHSHHPLKIHWFILGLLLGALLASLPWWMPALVPDFAQRLNIANPAQISHLRQEMDALKTHAASSAVSEDITHRIAALESAVTHLKQSSEQSVSTQDLHALLTEVKIHQTYVLLREYLDQGAPYAVFLETLLSLTPQENIRIDLQALEPFKESGILTQERLAQDLAKMTISRPSFVDEKAYDLSHLPEYFQHAWEYIKGLVRIRKASPSNEKPDLQNAITMAQERMTGMDLAGAISLLEPFSETNFELKRWLEQARERLIADKTRLILDTAFYTPFQQ